MRRTFVQGRRSGVACPAGCIKLITIELSELSVQQCLTCPCVTPVPSSPHCGKPPLCYRRGGTVITLVNFLRTVTTVQWCHVSMETRSSSTAESGANSLHSPSNIQSKTRHPLSVRVLPQINKCLWSFDKTGENRTNIVSNIAGT